MPIMNGYISRSAMLLAFLAAAGPLLAFGQQAPPSP